ncbi:transcriptional regulator [Antribacter gilvus]|uniref:transcriptional regulator n=1 Tax=Antribacter gilvus TaxID=2304675 RepID=UPI000F7B8FDF|nr:transcriptional regulator [Antribacter gilvus]
MTRLSSAGLLVLHAVRVLGFGEPVAVAQRYGLDPDETASLMLDGEARGWVTYTSFGGLGGWSLTASGRAENERELAAELDRAGVRAEAGEVYRAFLPLNARLQRACTDWQLRPGPGDPLAANDHGDAAWDAAVLDELTAVSQGLVPLASRLEGVLARFRGYDRRFTAALRRAQAGEHGWVDRTDVDSCHRVWFELHEDLVATLGIDRGAEV